MLRLVAVLISVTLSIPALAEQRVALVIGNDAYSNVPVLPGSATFCVSSALAPAQGNNYGARNLIDGNDDTAWVEGSGGQGAGDFVVIEFDTPRSVRGVTVRNGYAKNADIFGKNSRVKDVELVFSTGDSLQATLTDQTDEQRVNLNRPVKAKWVQLIIRSVYPGWKYSDTALNEFRVDAE